MNINYKKVICVVLSGFIIVTGCGDKNYQNNNQVETNIVENSLTNDEKTIEIFDDLLEQTKSLLDNDEIEEVETKLKGIFISVVDFIFCDGSVGGIKFNDLTEETKKNILNTANQIDELISKKFPNYKEDINDKTYDIYTKASNIIKNSVVDINELAKEKLSDDDYNTLIEVKNELAYYTTNTFDIISNFTTSNWSYSKDKIIKWYYNFKTGD